MKLLLKAMSSVARSFWQDNRRVDNTRIKSELGVQLNYPTYRDGLKGIFMIVFTNLNPIVRT